MKPEVNRSSSAWSIHPSSLKCAPHLHGLQNNPNAGCEQKQDNYGPGSKDLESPRWGLFGKPRPKRGCTQGNPISRVQGEQQPQVEKNDLQVDKPIRNRP